MIISKKKFNGRVAAEVSKQLYEESCKEKQDLARTEKSEEVKKELERQCKEVSSFRKVGKRFQYLGVTFVVVNIYDRRGSIDYGLFRPRCAVLACEFIDPNGKIARRNFDYEMLPVLKAENVR